MASQNNGQDRMSRAGEGKIALVTGGSKGIGLAIAHALAAAGASVVITGRDQAALERAVKSAPEGTRIRGVRADVQDPEDAARAVEEAVKAFGGLDILINNAGVGSFSNVADMTIADWDRTIGTNLSGVFYCCRAAHPGAAPARRRLDHQHQQPCQQERVRRRRGVLRDESRAECVQRSADAGGPVRQHPRQLHHAGIGRDRLRRT